MNKVTSEYVHDQHRADKACETLKGLWTKASTTNTTALRRFLSWVPPGGFTGANVYITAGALRKIARKSAGKDAGVDGWSGSEFAQLPECVFEPLAKIWQLVLNGAGLPKQWVAVRVSLIPKDDGGERPISVATMAWRTGMSVMVEQLRPWIDQGAPEELVGGLAGRDARDYTS